MTFKEMSGALQTAWVQNIGWKVPMILISVLVIFVIWESPPPSFISYSQFSASQIQSFLGRNDIPAAALANTSDSAPANAPTVHTNSPSADRPVPQAKKRPVEAKNPNRNSTLPLNTTTISESTPNPVNVFEDDTQLVPDNTTVFSEASTNATFDAYVEDDSQLLDPSTIKVQDDSQPSAPEETKYLVPLLRFQSGTGNQLMEYKSAAVIARTLNRTLCLVPFFGGPEKHFGYLGDKSTGLLMEGRYDIDVLSRFVKVAHMEECMKKCNWKIDVHWLLQISKPPKWQQWFNDTPRWSVDLSKEYRNWKSTADVEKALGPRNDAHCTALGGIFPGLQWRGVVIAAATYMQHSAQVMKATDLLQARGLPGTADNNFVAVHWRFEESKCSSHPLGLCFSRRRDGAVIANGRRSETWESMTRENLTNHPTRAGFNGVALAKEDISGAIYDRVVQWGVKNLYLASDGWIRGKQSGGILKWVVEDLRRKGLNVAGLWMLKGLPNFADGFTASAGNMGELFGLDPTKKVSSHIIALVEQEICLRAAVFVGSGQSSWSLAISDTRRGLRCKQELTESLSELNPEMSPKVIEQGIIDKILTIQVLAGPICKGSHFNSTMQNYEDEIPDGWLDYEACEVRLLQGKGNCQRITV